MSFASPVLTELPSGITWEYSQFKILYNYHIMNLVSFITPPAIYSLSLSLSLSLLFLLAIKYKYLPPKPVRSPSVSSFSFKTIFTWTSTVLRFQILDRKLRCGSAVARLMWLLVRIHPMAWKCVSSEYCSHVEVYATGGSLVQGIVCACHWVWS